MMNHLPMIRVVLACLCLTLFNTKAFADSFTEGTQYQRLGADVLQQAPIQELLDAAPGKIQVIEFFSFACHWCHAFEPHLNKWLIKKPANIVFMRVPVIFHPTWRPLAKTYFMLDVLQAHAKWDPLLFSELHDKHSPLLTDADIRKFMVSQGLSESQFDENYTSFAVARQLKWSEELSRAYQIRTVPTLIIHTSKGSFLTTPQMAGNGANMISILDSLLKGEVGG